MVRDEDYGRLPPKKLKRFRELVESGLKNPKAVTKKDLNEVTRLFLEAGGELPSDMEFKRGRLRWLDEEERCRSD
jgi:hypothetical protein